MDRFTSLATFVQVVDSGGFSAAARRLNMSVTMVSSHVQSLENRLGARLLNRTTRRVALTEIGKEYYDRCVNILAEVEEADHAASALHSTPRGTLRLYAGTHVVQFLAPVISEFLGLYPGVSVDLTIGERMIDLVEEGFDLAFRTVPLPDSSLIVRNLTPWQPILCCSPGYLETHRPPERLEDLVQHNCLRYAYYPFGDEWRFTGPDGEPAAVRVSGNLVTNSGEALRTVTLDGRGIFLAPSFLVGDDIVAGRLVRILAQYRPIEFAINAIYPHRHHLSSKVRTFIDLVAERFLEHKKWLNPEATG